MNTTKRTYAVLVAAAMLAGGAGLTASALASEAPASGTTASGAAASGAATGATATAATAGLSADAAKQLQLTREEERMARDLYAALAKAHDDARPMSMVTNAEDRHFDAVGTVLTRYGVSDPSAGRAAGSYAYPELQKLYDDWYAEGKANVNAAYQVGVELEKWDIAGLQKDVAAAQQNDVKQLYTHLLEASEHHLSAYEAAVSGQPVGPGAGGGYGMGNGMGKGMAGQPGNGGHYGQGAQGRGPGAGGHGFGGDCPMVDSVE